VSAQVPEFTLGLRMRSGAALVQALADARAGGFRRVWLYDSGRCIEAIAAMSFALSADPDLTVGVAVANTETRHPVVLANAFATMSNLSGGRVILALGRGDSALKFLGLKPTPLAVFEERVALIRSLLAGESVDVGGRVYRLPEPPKHVPLVLVSADGPRGCELAGRLADGAVIPMAASPSMFADLVQRVHAGAEEAGRNPDDLYICGWLHAAVGETTEEAIETILPEIGRSLVAPLVTPRHIPIPGVVSLRTEQLDHLRELASDQASERRLGGEVYSLTGAPLLQEIAVVGTADECRAKIEHLLEVRGVAELAFNVYPPTATRHFAHEVLSRGEAARV
jgi:5,10-methylenetetrahydromethanopterin reductase